MKSNKSLEFYSSKKEEVSGGDKLKTSASISELSNSINESNLSVNKFYSWLILWMMHTRDLTQNLNDTFSGYNSTITVKINVKDIS